MSKKKLLLPDSLTKQLIEEVKTRNCLWDTSIERHIDRIQVALAWKYIAEKLGLPEKLLKIKWKNVRDFYMRELKKGKSVDEYTGKWRWFESMSFLNVATRDTRDAGVPEDAERSVEQSPIPVVKLEVPDSNAEERVYCEEYQESMQSKESNYSSEDFDLMFLKSLAPYFKMLDPVRKLVVRGKMQKMILNEIAGNSSS